MASERRLGSLGGDGNCSRAAFLGGPVARDRLALRALLQLSLAHTSTLHEAAAPLWPLAWLARPALRRIGAGCSLCREVVALQREWRFSRVFLEALAMNARLPLVRLVVHIGTDVGLTRVQLAEVEALLDSRYGRIRCVYH